MPSRFSVGIEEEFQMVDQHTGQLVPCIHTILDKAVPVFGEQIKPEMLQSNVEIISTVCPDIASASIQMRDLRTKLAKLVADEGLALVSSGTHPGAIWMDQLTTRHPRYLELQEEFQDVARSVLIFGMHVHVGVKNQEMAVLLMNQARTWLPHLLALSSNSPFWAGRFTGLKSYRAIVWKRFPRNGIPDVFAGWKDFDDYIQTLVNTQCIDNGKKIWWDIRPHPFFNTIEFRIFDMPATFHDTMALAALSQALIAKLSWLHDHHASAPILQRSLLDENKWRASRYGLDATIVDFANNRQIRMRDSISELLDFVEDMSDDLGTRNEMNYLRTLLSDPRGTGADRQIALYRQTGSIEAVIQMLRQQTIEGLGLSVDVA